LIKGGEILERTRAIDTVVFDKTGTLTEARMRVEAVQAATGTEPASILDLAASLEAGSEHPIAAAIARASDRRMSVDGFRSHPGRGVIGTVETPWGAVSAAVGRRQLFDRVPDDVEVAADEQERAGHTVVLVGWDGVARGLVAVA